MNPQLPRLERMPQVERRTGLKKKPNLRPQKNGAFSGIRDRGRPRGRMGRGRGHSVIADRITARDVLAA